MFKKFNNVREKRRRLEMEWTQVMGSVVRVVFPKQEKHRMFEGRHERVSETGKY